MKNFPARLDEIAREKAVDVETIEIWFEDEARIGQKNKITRRWAKRGTRPSAPRDQRTASTYIFGAVCPKEGKGAALILPTCNTEAMNLHLAEIAKTIAPGVHAVLLVDQAGWHTSKRLIVPPNITIIALLPKSPELNPVENIWQTVCSLSVRMWLVHAMRRARVASDRPAPSLTHRGWVGPPPPAKPRVISQSAPTLVSSVLWSTARRAVSGAYFVIYMDKPKPDPVFEARQWKSTRGWYVRVSWRYGQVEHVSGFASGDDAENWIKEKSDACSRDGAGSKNWGLSARATRISSGL